VNATALFTGDRRREARPAIALALGVARRLLQSSEPATQPLCSRDLDKAGDAMFWEASSE
jgi:hypothetical protein